MTVMAGFLPIAGRNIRSGRRIYTARPVKENPGYQGAVVTPTDGGSPVQRGNRNIYPSYREAVAAARRGEHN